MFKLQPMIDILNIGWIQFGTFEPDVCIDEQMMPYYGHNSIKQFMKGDPVRYGYKIMMMLCSSSGYCYQFHIKCGKKNISSDEQANLPWGQKLSWIYLIAFLTRGPSMSASTTFFTIHHLTLLKEGIQVHDWNRKSGSNATGILRASLQTGFPRRLVNYSDSDMKVVHCKYCKSVCVASNYEAVTLTSTCQRKVAGQKEEVGIPQPRMIATYNAKMGGVDLLDNLVSFYRIRIYSKEWYSRIIYKQFDLCCLLECMAIKCNPKSFCC